MHAYPQPGGPQPAAGTSNATPSQSQGAAAAPAPATGDGYNLSAEEEAQVLHARQTAIAMIVVGVICVLTSWTTWVGIVAGLISLLVGVTLMQRMVDGNTVYNGRSALCCCCSTPWSQLDACSSGAITACAFGVVTVIVNVALIATTYSVRQLLGIVALVNAFAAIGVIVAGAIGMRATRSVIRTVFHRIDHDINQFTPAAVATGVVVPPPSSGQQYAQQHPQQQHPQQQYQQQYQQQPPQSGGGGGGGFSVQHTGTNQYAPQQGRSGAPHHGAPPQKTV